MRQVPAVIEVVQPGRRLQRPFHPENVAIAVLRVPRHEDQHLATHLPPPLVEFDSFRRKREPRMRVPHIRGGSHAAPDLDGAGVVIKTDFTGTDAVQAGISVGGRRHKNKNAQSGQYRRLTVAPAKKEPGEGNEPGEGQDQRQMQPGAEEDSGYPDAAKIDEQHETPLYTSIGHGDPVPDILQNSVPQSRHFSQLVDIPEEAMLPAVIDNGPGPALPDAR